jgi:hypothetical protein
VSCPYHGWEWNGTDGLCSRVPAIPTGKPPAGARIPAYEVQEKWGLVWTCLGDPIVGLPEFPELEGKNLVWLNSPEIPQDCGIVAATENFRDVAHFPFVHQVSMGVMPETVDPLTVRREGYEAWTSKLYKAPTGGSAEKVFTNTGDVYHHYHSVAPCFSSIVMDYEGMGNRYLLNTVQPVGAGGHGCIVRFAVAMDDDYEGASLEECLAGEMDVYLEDTPIVNALMPLEVPFGEGIEYSTVADKYTAAYRAAFLELVQDALAGGVARHPAAAA